MNKKMNFQTMGSLILSFAALFVLGGILTTLRYPPKVFSGRTKLSLPVAFSNYKKRTPLHTSPYAVPPYLYLLCRAPAQADWARAQQKYGPHTEHYVQVYGNQVAKQAFGPKARHFLTGALIAKEKLAESPDGDAEGVAFWSNEEPRNSARAGVGSLSTIRSPVILVVPRNLKHNKFREVTAR